MEFGKQAFRGRFLRKWEGNWYALFTRERERERTVSFNISGLSSFFVETHTEGSSAKEDLLED